MDAKIKKHISALLKINDILHKDNDENWREEEAIESLLIKTEGKLLAADKLYDAKKEKEYQIYYKKRGERRYKKYLKEINKT